MMDINRRALYNSLRMNWVLDPTLKVEAWQVEDYRSLPLDIIFERLEDHHLRIDKPLLVALAENVDTPEELLDAVIGELHLDKKATDQVYLLLFELWRRLMPEKLSLSILCDELDRQIHLYDREQNESPEAIQDVLANLQVVLDENVDSGMKPLAAMECIKEGCANDLESFLHDFISEQIDNGNVIYAQELLEGFSQYVDDAKWFDFLRARVMEESDPHESMQIVKKLIDKKAAKGDLEFNLEMLSFLVHAGEKETFETLAKRTLELIKNEEDFQLLLSICADFYHRLDQDNEEQALQSLIDQRSSFSPEQLVDRTDPHVRSFRSIISAR